MGSVVAGNMSITKYVGLHSAARRFLRRFVEIKSGNHTTGADGTRIPLGTWEPRDVSSHILEVRERVQSVESTPDGQLLFTYLETEYKCGAREEFFRWRIRPAYEGDDDYNVIKGIIWS